MEENIAFPSKKYQILKKKRLEDSFFLLLHLSLYHWKEKKKKKREPTWFILKMEKETEEGGSHYHHHRICDYCESSVALVYCKADSAKLCLACDKQVHVTNQLFSKHFRSLLCDSCDDSPSSVFCDTESSVLCQNCDWQHHTSSSSLHSRRPLEGFSGCPSVTELLALVGLDDLTDKPLFLPEGSEHTPPEIVSLNDLVASGGSSHNYRAMDVPPLPKVCIYAA